MSLWCYYLDSAPLELSWLVRAEAGSALILIMDPTGMYSRLVGCTDIGFIAFCPKSKAPLSFLYVIVHFWSLR